jgi:ACS family tartrate transporter-like MFS transporter
MLLVSSRIGRWWLPAVCLAGAAGFSAAAVAPNLPVVLTGFCFASVGVFGAMPLFWSASTGHMSGKVAGAAIATVNSIGAMGGFVAPYAMGWLHDRTHSYSTGLWAIAASMAAGALIVSTSHGRRWAG